MQSTMISPMKHKVTPAAIDTECDLSGLVEVLVDAEVLVSPGLGEVLVASSKNKNKVFVKMNARKSVCSVW